MKKAVKTFFALAAISLALCSCSDSGSSGSDGDSGTENRVLDLRIQNGGVARWIEKEVSGTYEAETDLVKVTAESDGMHFTIKNPATLAGSDEKYKEGCNWIGVYRLENIGGEEIQTTLAVVDKSPFEPGHWNNETWIEQEPAKEINFVYPLCEAGEQYKFKVQIEPQRGLDENGIENPVDRDHGYFHYLTLTAKGGIGDIDYSNLKNGEWVFASYSDNKATVWIENVIPPQDSVVKNVGTYIDIFYGNKEWISGETDWYCLYENPSAVEKNVSFELKSDFGLQSIQNYSNTFFAQYSFTFEVPDCPQVSQWRTVTLESDLVSLN
ncbi:MAG: hypothetical protein MR771_07360 [Treponema succinifaciens]|uniref:hypothetical protein n=1 Tax=Treponema succinifaciens TaxID=167 RepID=UPI0023567714|nr:hypothetical protein [Treponema succinifaciens]MCI6912965.1 hypothetical protein [Treponema succinifaciens]